ncbi:MAG: PilZ domain-containing protein [Sedimentibacter sp.]|uniref:PilZ domain-containing protein n=1 Tax=Sedimentibacter sp. TaxID=1960295 RepID=UPI0031597BA4
MDNPGLLVKVYDEKKEELGSGHLLSINSETIRIKGSDLPVITSGTKVHVEIFNELVGISPYVCEIGVASRNQLNAHILSKQDVVERRNSLKVRTDLSFNSESLLRNGKDITDEVPNMKIHVMNLSVGGMLISSNYELSLYDELTFRFQYAKYQVISLHAKVIRIDKKQDPENEDLKIVNYGCSFEKMTRYNESVITQYLFDRQLQLYKNR